MSIRVDPQELAATLADFGAGYLLTVSGEGRVKAVTVEPAVDEGALVITAPGRGSIANASTNAAVTVLFPPVEVHGYTLLVDGRASVVDGDDVRIRPESAVLHRPADHADGPPAPATAAATDGACSNDCSHL